MACRRRAEKTRGCSPREASQPDPGGVDDDFVKGIKAIYDETPMRQGRRFWHYQPSRSRARCEAMNATYLERSQLVGAYLENEMVGFVKYIRVDATAVLIQILAMDAHRDKTPDACIAAADHRALPSAGIEMARLTEITTTE